MTLTAVPVLPKLLIVIVTLNSIASQLLLKRAVAAIGSPTSVPGLVPFFRAAAITPEVYLSLVLQVIGYAVWMIVIAHEKLGVAVAVMGSGFYIAMALLGWMVFGEELSHVQWAGVVLITIGIACMIG